MARGATIAGVVAGLVPAVVVAAVVLADDRPPAAREPPTSTLGREAAYLGGVYLHTVGDDGCGMAVPELMVTRDRLVLIVRHAPIAWEVARDGGEWVALAAVLAGLRRDPVVEGLRTILVYPKAGVPYRDVIRAYEAADHAGFAGPWLAPAWGSSVEPLAPPRVALGAGVARVEAGLGSPEVRRFATDAAGTAALVAWLAERSPVPAQPGYTRWVEVAADATVRASEQDRVDDALRAAGLQPMAPR
ncbi:MAG: hypothetical protein JNK64_37400 [Myxococcales bacterium]|nr:hypothetical protein [Myxococcales bacterium]